MSEEEPKDREHLIDHLTALEKPLTIEDIKGILGSTVRKDDNNKVITFLCMLLTYTDQDQVNIGFLAESSSGKSYIPLELAWYFPKEDVIKIGYASPTSFFHEWGKMETDPADTRDIEDDKKHKITHIDLERKILLFLDQPHDLLLQRLRSLLSHDDREITHKITDKGQKFGMRTKTIIIRGFSTVIFCSARFSMMDQEKTRLLLQSPEINQEKLREAIMLKIDKESDRQDFFNRMESDPRRNLLAARVHSIKTAHINHVKIKVEQRSQIAEHFLGSRLYLIPRHQRDISRLLGIIKGHALLNFQYRENGEGCIYANDEDILVGFQLYSNIAEANELGLSPELFNIYTTLKPEIKLNGKIGVSRSEFQKMYYEAFHKILGRESGEDILKVLCTCGLMVEQKGTDLSDKRLVKYVLADTGTTTETEEEQNSERYPGESAHSFSLDNCGECKNV
jgi:hypothetical protein